MSGQKILSLSRAAVLPCFGRWHGGPDSMSQRKFTSRFFTGAVGVALTCAVGIGLWLFPFGAGLVRLSYDLPFAFGPKTELDDIVIIKMDGTAFQKLNQVWHQPWDPALHARLVRQLTADQCRMIVFDVWFADTGSAELAEAIQANGKVVLAGSEEPLTHEGLIGVQYFPPREPLLQAAQAWGVAALEQDHDSAVRKHYPGTELYPGLAWAAASLAEAPITKNPGARRTERWLRYYGSYGTVPSLSYHLALDKPHGHFRDKIVFIGGGPRTRFVGDETDQFRTPYTRRDGQYFAGVEIMATMFENLLRGDWLNRMSPARECALVLVAGLLFGSGLTLVRPVAAAGLAVLGMLGVGALALLAVWQYHVWFAWMVIAAGQIPVALAVPLFARASRGSAAAPVIQEPLALAESSVSDDVPTRVEPPDRVQSLPSIPDHSLLRCVGKGSYGQVWLARNVIGMHHAVKIVHQNEFHKPEPYEREFSGIQKFMPVSLNHPGLVHIVHVGRNDEKGYFYYIMELGDDERSGAAFEPSLYSPKNLRKELEKRGRLPLEECVRLFLPLTEALDFLHRQKLIHRDIKPSNIIFVNGSPKFADIGLVTDLNAESGDSTYVGTEGYIAPEGPGTVAADIFSFGKLIYETCTGLDRRKFPELPGDVVPGAAMDGMLQLHRIVLKACASSPRTRYQSAAELHEELRHLQTAIGS
jgi:CHASE2 domain-containing sensor protein